MSALVRSLAACALAATLAAAAEPLPFTAGSTVAGRLASGGQERTFRLHVPRDLRAGAAVVLVLHGTGGDAASMVSVTGFDALADQVGFVVAYPEALGGNWLDLAHGGAADRNTDFAVDLVDAIAATVSIDQRRIYATGLSAGGTMSLLLACDARGRFAAVAPVAGALSPGTLGLIDGMRRPTSVLMINGTADAIVPYWGGALNWTGANTTVAPAPTTAWTIAGRDGCGFFPAWSELPDTAWWDSCRAQRTRWTGGLGGSEVELWTIVGGGHTWPGSRIWLPWFVFGGTCYDIDGTAEIWSFFQRHPRAGSPAG